MRYDDDGPREPLLRKRTTNTTSQIAIVGANVCPIESLDYEYVFSYVHILGSSRPFQIVSWTMVVILMRDRCY